MAASAKTVLISGIGIAGPALAYWLLRHGIRPTLVERASKPRTGGYIIDFWGAGYDLVERMGLLPEVLSAGYSIREVRLVDSHSRRVGGFDAEVFRQATGGHYVSLARGDLSAMLYRSLDGRAETLFGDSLVGLDQDHDGVVAHFESSSPRRFDAVIGADGLHSVVREIVFGPSSQFERYLGYTVGAFQVSGYPHRDDDIYIGHSVPGRQVTRFSMRDGRTMFLLVAAEDRANVGANDGNSQRRYLKERFAGIGWECPEILRALERCEDLYFDRVSQIRLDEWSHGRVALVGDAAFAPSLLAGQGSALAIVAAYVLAGELASAARIPDAFERYETRLGAFMRRKQHAAESFAAAFVPRTQFGLLARNQITKALAVPGVAKLLMGSTLVDKIALPAYSSR